MKKKDTKEPKPKKAKKVSTKTVGGRPDDRNPKPKP